MKINTVLTTLTETDRLLIKQGSLIKEATVPVIKKSLAPELKTATLTGTSQTLTTTVTALNGLQLTATTAGIYMVAANVLFQQSGSDYGVAYITVDGVEQPAFTMLSGFSIPGSQQVTTPVSGVLTLTAGQVVRIAAKSALGSVIVNSNTTYGVTNMSMVKMS